LSPPMGAQIAIQTTTVLYAILSLLLLVKP